MATDRTDLEAAFADGWPASEWRDLHVAIAVSGGADSVALLRLTHAAKCRAGGNGRLFVVHLNHGIRSNAAEDAAWLERLCGHLELPCEVGTADVPGIAALQGNGLEAAARMARYEFLQRSAEKLGARFVALAHTANDQVETVLHRILRGTGIAGLTGIPAARPLSAAVQLVRPMLGLWRADVERYLAELDQDFRVDATNSDRRHTRNRIRHDLLPLLRAEFNPDVDAALLRLAQQAGEAQQTVNALAEELVRRAVTTSPGGLKIDCRLLAVEPPLVVREACKLAWNAAGWPLQDMGHDEWHQLQSLITAPSSSGSLNLPGHIRAVRAGDKLQISQSTQAG
jgi:tRNA(Ile)-lysidine synthase